MSLPRKFKTYGIVTVIVLDPPHPPLFILMFGPIVLQKLLPLQMHERKRPSSPTQPPSHPRQRLSYRVILLGRLVSHTCVKKEGDGGSPRTRGEQ